MLHELPVDASCPACGKPKLVLRTSADSLAYFGDALHSVLLCGACGYKQARTTFLEMRPPARCTLRFRAPGDLAVRVVRSYNAEWRVPELGFTATPSEASEAFVSNIEGMLERIRDVLVRAVVLDADARPQAEALLAKLDRILHGHEEATLVLEDPAGHSAILSERTVIEPLDPAEAEAMLAATHAGFVDATDLAGA